MLKILRSKKKVEESTKCEKATQCDLFDAHLRVYIIEKLPKYAEPSVENFNAHSQRLHLIMNTFKIKEKDKVSYLLACIRGKANEMLQQSQVLIDGDTTWEQAITKLKELFDTSLIHGNIQTLKMAKQQPDQNFQEFTIIIQKMVHNIFTQKQGYTDAQREAETIRYSIRGTKNQLKQQLKGFFGLPEYFHSPKKFVIKKYPSRFYNTPSPFTTSIPKVLIKNSNDIYRESYVYASDGYRFCVFTGMNGIYVNLSFLLLNPPIRDSVTGSFKVWTKGTEDKEIFKVNFSNSNLSPVYQFMSCTEFLKLYKTFGLEKY